MTQPEQTPSFLVIGNAVNESVTRAEDGRTRRHAGGVGAVMARELALAGARVTFLTTSPPGPDLDEIRRRLDIPGLTLLADTGDPPQRKSARVAITVRAGEYAGAQGNWPRMGGLAREIEELTPRHDCSVVSLNPANSDLQAALRHSPFLVANATTAKLAPHLLSLPGLTAATLNARELGALRAAAGKRFPDEELPALLQARAVLVTRGPRGMSLITPDSHRRAPAAPTPPQTDFIGAGDAATAGLAWALVNKLPPLATTLLFTNRLIQRNAAGYEIPD